MSVKRISNFNISQRGVLSGIYGNTRNSELFLDKDLYACNISRALYLYFKEENYRVVFYDPLSNKGFWSYSEHDLADFFCLKATDTTDKSDKSDKTLPLYTPKIKTPFGGIKPRLKTQNQRGQSQTNKKNGRELQGQKRGVISHYQAIDFHDDGRNSFFKLHSSPSAFHNVFENAEERFRTPFVLVYENPENIVPEQPDEIENLYANFIKTYAEKELKLKIVVVFGDGNRNQLTATFERENRSIFFRRSFALKFGLALSTQNTSEDHENRVNFEQNMYKIGFPEKDEIANLLIKKRICEGLQGTLTPKPFTTLVQGIASANFKIIDKEKNMTYPSDTQRLMYSLLDSEKTNLSNIIDSIGSGESVEQELRNRIGMQEVANQVSRLMKIMLRERELEKQKGKKSKSPIRPHMVFLGNPGTGKTTAAKLIGEWFREKNILSKGHFVETKASDLISQYVGGTRIKTSEKCEEAMGGILFIDEAYGLCMKKTDGGVNYEAEAQEILLQYMEKPDFMVIFAGYSDQINELMSSPNNPGLPGRIVKSNYIQFKDYTPDELFAILMQNVESPTTEAFQNTMKAILKKLYQRKDVDWANARSVENIWQEIRGVFFSSSASEIDVCHIPQEYLSLIDDKDAIDVEQELRNRIGMQEVANQVSRLMKVMLRERELEEKTGRKSKSPIRPHMVFLGNPGTGKTTAAKLIGKWFREKNILTKGHFVDAKASDLISQYVGGTRIKTSEKCEEAMGGILFIDEAYGLCMKKTDGGVNYEAEAQEILLQYMEKPDFMVIFAGYTDQINELMSSPNNPGLPGRFVPSNYIQFKDYTPEELLAILNQFIDYNTTEAFQNAMKQVFEELYQRKDAKWANARSVQNIWQEIRGIFLESSATEIDACHIPQEYLNMIEDKKDDATGQQLQDMLGAKSNNDRSISIDLSHEKEESRAINVEHLEHSVGLLKCSNGSNDGISQGTAFIISLENNYILTCSHVVEGKKQFTFSISELQFETPARLLWNNPQRDMALLQVGGLPKETRYLSLYQDEKHIGKTTEIIMAGYPLGEAVSRNLMINTGEITNYEENKQNRDRCFDCYMSNIIATFGNSGGPIINKSNYQVVGLLQGGFEQVDVRLITDIRQLFKQIEIINNQKNGEEV